MANYRDLKEKMVYKSSTGQTEFVVLKINRRGAYIVYLSDHSSVVDRFYNIDLDVISNEKSVNLESLRFKNENWEGFNNVTLVTKLIKSEVEKVTKAIAEYLAGEINYFGPTYGYMYNSDYNDLAELEARQKHEEKLKAATEEPKEEEQPEEEKVEEAPEEPVTTDIVSMEEPDETTRVIEEFESLIIKEEPPKEEITHGINLFRYAKNMEEEGKLLSGGTRRRRRKDEIVGTRDIDSEIKADRIYSDEEVLFIIDQTNPIIASRYGFSVDMAARIKRAANDYMGIEVELRSDADYVTLFEQGHSIDAVQKITGCSIGTIRASFNAWQFRQREIQRTQFPDLDTISIETMIEIVDKGVRPICLEYAVAYNRGRNWLVNIKTNHLAKNIFFIAYGTIAYKEGFEESIKETNEWFYNFLKQYEEDYVNTFDDHASMLADEGKYDPYLIRIIKKRFCAQYRNFSDDEIKMILDLPKEEFCKFMVQDPDRWNDAKQNLQSKIKKKSK